MLREIWTNVYGEISQEYNDDQPIVTGGDILVLEDGTFIRADCEQDYAKCRGCTPAGGCGADNYFIINIDGDTSPATFQTMCGKSPGHVDLVEELIK